MGCRAGKTMNKVTITNISRTNQKLLWFPGAPVLTPSKDVQTDIGMFFNSLKNPITRRNLEKQLSENRLSIVIGDAPKKKNYMASKPRPKRKVFQDYGITINSNGYPNAMQFKTEALSEDIDMALILCHYGQDKARLNAAKEALAWTLQSNPKPYIIIVEATEDNKPKHFNKTTADLYIHRTVEAKSKGMWLKEALWTIGADEAIKKNYNKLVFLDMDSAFIKQDWAKEVSEALNNYDIISPHSHRYFANQKEGIQRGLDPSKGYLYSKGIRAGHPGISIALTKDTYQNVFNSRLYLSPNGAGDTIMWMHIAGWQEEYNNIQYFPFEYTRNLTKGIRPTPRIGYVDNIIAHYPHGPIEQRNYLPRAMLARTCFPVKYAALNYDDKGMPFFKDEKAGNIFRKTLPHTFNKQTVTCRTIRDIYDEHALEEYGPIDDNNPLVITCLYRAGGIYTPRHVQWLKEQFDRHCKAPFRFVCQTNEAIPNVETIPLVTTFEQAPFQWGQIEHYRDIWGPNTSVVTCDLDTVVYRDFIPHQCPHNQVFMTRETGNWVQPSRVTWNCGFSFFRGNFQKIFDMYVEDVKRSDYRKPDYTSIGSQENICAYLRTIGIYPQSIEAHFCVRFYPLDPNAILSETTILSFPGKPKPWDIQPRPNWIPEL